MTDTICIAFRRVGGDVVLAKQAARQLSAAVLPRFGATTSISRSGTEGLAAVAFGFGCDVGIDVQRINADWVDEDLIALTLHQEERTAAPQDLGVAFFDVWTRKEAALKAAGTGLCVAPATVKVGWRNVEWTRALIEGAPNICVKSIHAPSGYAAAVAMRQWSPGSDVAVRVFTEDAPRVAGLVDGQRRSHRGAGPARADAEEAAHHLGG